MTDKEMILNPDEWPAWPYLPLVRGAQREENGLIVDIKDYYPSTIILVNMFALPKTYGEFQKLPMIKYDSLDDLLAAGWKID